MADHVHWSAPMGAWVLINETWFKWSACSSRRLAFASREYRRTPMIGCSFRPHAAADSMVHSGNIASRFTPHGQPLDVGDRQHVMPRPTAERWHINGNGNLGLRLRDRHGSSRLCCEPPQYVRSRACPMFDPWS